jgi:hypothetical protein
MRTASERGRYSRDKGVRFERRLAKMFRDAGLTSRRIMEWDRGCGNDLEVGVVLRPFTSGHPQVTHWLSIGIQAKATERESDLQTGLTESQTGKPDAQAWVCIHAFKRTLRILYLGADCPVPTELSWPELLKKIWALSPLT